MGWLHRMNQELIPSGESEKFAMDNGLKLDIENDNRKCCCMSLNK